MVSLRASLARQVVLRGDGQTAKQNRSSLNAERPVHYGSGDASLVRNLTRAHVPAGVKPLRKGHLLPVVVARAAVLSSAGRGAASAVALLVGRRPALPVRAGSIGAASCSH